MRAKERFREGWIMLLRPFRFANMQPLQKMTILYAYCDKALFDYELNSNGQKLLKDLKHYSENSSLIGGYHPTYSKHFKEDRQEYEERMAMEIDKIYQRYATQEIYKGAKVEGIVEGQLCKFYPDEYNVISRETFDHILTCDENEYKIEVEDDTYFDIKSIKEKIFYINSRGINKSKAKKMVAKEARDAVIFRPQPAVLQMFCREHEIY